jgi:phosphoribosylaminoimidazole-succinocarboxamide synthase
MEKLSEGKTKIVYATDDPDEVLLEFKDSITALDGEKRDVLKGKGRINAEISGILFKHLNKNNVPTHFIKLVNSKTMRVNKLDMIPVEVVCRNFAAGHFVTRFPMFKRGQALKKPVIEFYLKDDSLHDPLLVEDHIIALNLASSKELRHIRRVTIKVNEILKNFLIQRKLKLIDFKLEFGRDKNGAIKIGDELNCDSMRLWDLETNKVLDKDLYRQGVPLNEVMEAYVECHRRIVGGKQID